MINQAKHIPSKLIKPYTCCAQSKKSDEDFVDAVLSSSITLFYTVNSFVELIAWLSEAKMLRFKAAKWFKYSLILWMGALSSGILKTARRLPEAGWRQWIKLLGQLADLISASSMLPNSITRKLLYKIMSPVQSMALSATLSFVASNIALYHLF